MEDKRQQMIRWPWLCPLCPSFDFYCQLTRNINPPPPRSPQRSPPLVLQPFFMAANHNLSSFLFISGRSPIVGVGDWFGWRFPPSPLRERSPTKEGHQHKSKTIGQNWLWHDLIKRILKTASPGRDGDKRYLDRQARMRYAQSP